MSVSFVLSINVLIISLMQSVNGTLFLITIFFQLFGAAAVPVFGTVIVPLTSMYASHKFDFNAGVLNLI